MIAGNSSGHLIDRLTADNGSFVISDCSVGTIHNTNHVIGQGSVLLSGLAVSKAVSNCTISEFGALQVTGGVAGDISMCTVGMGSSLNINGTCGSATLVSAEDQSTVTLDGGAVHNRISVKLGGNFTSGAFSHTGVSYWTNAAITATAANTNRSTYRGLVSTLPVI
jgi:hypothetical protein